MTDVYVSGGGVMHDQPLPAGTRLRLSPTGDPSEDVEVWCEGGEIRLAGHYLPLTVAVVDAQARVRTQPMNVLTTADVAGILNISARGVRLAVTRERLRAVGCDATGYLFDRGDVTAYAASRRK